MAPFILKVAASASDFLNWLHKYFRATMFRLIFTGASLLLETEVRGAEEQGTIDGRFFAGIEQLLHE
jgi:hypothetical protein